MTHTAPFDNRGLTPLRADCGQRLDSRRHVVVPQTPSCPDCQRLNDEDDTSLQRLVAP